jgi:predicted transcriptional regulator
MTTSVTDKVYLSASTVARIFIAANPDASALDAMSFMDAVYASLLNLSAPGNGNAPAETVPEARVIHRVPCMSVDDAITADGMYIHCLIDGKKMKMLKGYIRRVYGMTPDDYRKAFDLPTTYSLTAPGYHIQKSQYAKEMGLGSAENKAGKRALQRELVTA